jgi:hypothetical protein
MSPDIVVLTEYVEEHDHDEFLEALSGSGLASVLLTAKTKGENQVLIASREELNSGVLKAPPIHPSVPQNALHVVTTGGLHVLGFRMPTSRDFDRVFRRPTWDWVLGVSAHLLNKPAVIIGDFNTAPGDPISTCGDYIDRMSQMGWIHARPASGYSFRHSSGTERQIDHCFVSPTIKVERVEYVWDFHDMASDAASGTVGIPDHAMLIADVKIASI